MTATAGNISTYGPKKRKTTVETWVWSEAAKDWVPESKRVTTEEDPDTNKWDYTPWYPQPRPYYPPFSPNPVSPWVTGPQAPTVTYNTCSAHPLDVASRPIGGYM